MHRRCFGILFFLLILGCQQAVQTPPSTGIEGTVTLDGTPVPDGTIYFATPGAVPESLAIRDGKFSGTVSVGKKRVEIAAWRPYKAEKLPPGVAPLPSNTMENYLPLRYHASSTLNVTVQETGNEKLKFELTSSP